MFSRAHVIDRIWTVKKTSEKFIHKIELNRRIYKQNKIKKKMAPLEKKPPLLQTITWILVLCAAVTMAMELNQPTERGMYAQNV